MMLELDDVSKRYEATVALAPTSLRIIAGHTTVLIGPSGCGKSTLLRIMIGLVPPDAGTVRLDDTVVSADTVEQIRQRMGYVIQDGGLFPHLTAARNITLMARYLGWSAERIESRLAELVDLTRFPTDGLDRYPVQLSGGQRQRVSLMRALMLDPAVILLDEPLGALDPMMRSEMQTDLRDIFRKLGKTVVMVTHDMGEACFFADTIVLMREGRIVQVGSFDDMVERPEDDFVTQFIHAQRSPLEDHLKA
jgi:osmoprotectant transport system ATP-binding protein